MTMIAILQYPDSRLGTRAEKVKDVNDKRIQTIIDNMFETLYNTDNCAGLAATQLDIPNPPHITVIDVSENKTEPLCLINPELISTDGEKTEYEGCMSVSPDEIHAEVTRGAKIKARALDRTGKTIEIEAEGLLAKCIQHEIDHLNGILYIDHLSKLKRHRIDKKLAKIVRLRKS